MWGERYGVACVKLALSYYCPLGPTMGVVGGQPFVRSGLYLLFGQGGPTLHTYTCYG